jgi:hypothetical protein
MKEGTTLSTYNTMFHKRKKKMKRKKEKNICRNGGGRRG